MSRLSKNIAYAIKKQNGSASPAFCYLLAVFWLGMGWYLYSRHEADIAGRKLADPASISTSFMSARCYREPYRRPSATLEKTYHYSPPTTASLQTSYQVVDLIRYRSIENCESELNMAALNFPRTHVWYDKSDPAKARWDLKDPSPDYIFGFTAIMAGVSFLIGLSNRQSRRQRR